MAFMFISSCYTIDQARDENDRTFKQDALLTIWMVDAVYPKGECDVRSKKESCSGKNKLVCNGYGKWEVYQLCPTSCTIIPNQDMVKCE